MATTTETPGARLAEALTLEALGLSQESLADRLVDRLAEGLLSSLDYDEDGHSFRGESPFATKLNRMVKDRLGALVLDLGEKHVLPKVNEMVEGLVLQETNRWGEKVGQPVTFIEYLTQRADAWMREEVDYGGKAKAEGDSYSWRKAGTRVSWVIDRHLQHSIETAMKGAVASANQSIIGGLQETVKIKLAEVAAALKVEVKTK